MNDKSETLESKIPFEDRERLEQPILPEPPLYPEVSNWRFIVHLCIVPLFIGMFIYVNFLEKTNLEFLQDSTWLIQRPIPNQGEDYVHYFIWHFDDSGELQVFRLWEDPVGKETYTYTLKKGDEICFEGDGPLNNITTDISRKEDGSIWMALDKYYSSYNYYWFGTPIKIRYPRGKKEKQEFFREFKEILLQDKCSSSDNETTENFPSFIQSPADVDCMD